MDSELSDPVEHPPGDGQQPRSNRQRNERDMPRISEALAGARIGSRVRQLEVELVARERRTLWVLRNLFLSLRKSNSRPRKKAALWAAANWLIFGAPFIATFTVGGLVTVFLALQANRLLSDQNGKIDLQNQLLLTQIHQVEASRSISRSSEIANFLKEVGDQKFPCQRPNRESFCLPTRLESQLAILLNSFRPYRMIGGSEIRVEMQSVNSTKGPLRYFGLDKSAERLKAGLPELSRKEYSPERGQILVGLNLEGISLSAPAALAASELDRSQMMPQQLPQLTFSGASVPPGALLLGAFLDGIDLSGTLMQAAELDSVIALDSDFSESDLALSDFFGSFLDDTKFRSSRLVGVSFGGSQIRDVDFSFADLRDATFWKSDLSGSSFDFANLEGASFQGTTGLTPEQLLWACFDATTVFDPELAEFIADLQPPSGCMDLWPRNQADGAWLTLDSARPQVGESVRARGELRAEGRILACIDRRLRWTGDSFKNEDRQDPVHGSGRYEIVWKSWLRGAEPTTATIRIVDPGESFGSCEAYWGRHSEATTGRGTAGSA